MFDVFLTSCLEQYAQEQVRITNNIRNGSDEKHLERQLNIINQLIQNIIKLKKVRSNSEK
jgi:hypothetical protein